MTAAAPASVLCVGHAVQDFLFTVETLPTKAEKHRATGFTAVGGGPAATAAVAIARLGGQARLIARVGDDPVADIIVRELEGHGVDCRDMVRLAGHGSSLSSVFVDARGERQIVNWRDPVWPAATAAVPDPLPPVGAVLADVRWPEGAAVALALARAAGIPAVLDGDVPLMPGSALLSAATHIAFSQPGIAQLTGEADPARGLLRARAQTPAWLCVTVGGQGVLELRDDTVVAHPGFDVPVVDTLGAGDVWHGAFTLALAEGRDTPGAIRFASAAAALKVQQHGGRAGAPTRAQLNRFLETVA